MLVDRILKRGDSAEAHLMMGMAKRGAQDLAGGLEELGKAVALNPELPGVHALYGRALLETGNRDRAQAEFEAELARNPLDFDAHLYLGVLLKEDAEVRRGDGPLRAAPSASGPAIRACATRSSRSTCRAARPTGPCPLLEAIVKEAPAFLEAHVTLATVYYRLKRREDGDRERAIIDALNKEIQAKQPGAVAPNTPETPPVR